MVGDAFEHRRLRPCCSETLENHGPRRGINHLGARKRGSRPSAPKSSRPSSDRLSLPVSGDTPRGDQGRSPRPAADGAERLSPDGPAKRPSGRDEALGSRRRRNRCMARVGVCAAYLRTTPNTVNPAWLSGIRRVRPAGIEPAACGLKDMSSPPRLAWLSHFRPQKMSRNDLRFALFGTYSGTRNAGLTALTRSGPRRALRARLR